MNEYTYMYVYIYIYIFIHTERARERLCVDDGLNLMECGAELWIASDFGS